MTLALGCQLENALGQCGLERRGSLLRPKGGPSVLQRLPQEGDCLKIEVCRLFHSYGTSHGIRASPRRVLRAEIYGGELAHTTWR